MWAKNRAIALQRWRRRWEAALADYRRYEASVQRATARIIRRRAWETWLVDQQQLALPEGERLVISSTIDSKSEAGVHNLTLTQGASGLPQSAP